MKKKLPNVQLVNARQISFGARLGLDLAGSTLRVAAARVEDCIRSEFHNESLGSPSQKQISLAAEFGHDITSATERVAYAVVADILEQLDHDTIAAEGLAPGVTVRNIHDKHTATYVISSIHPDLVYFKGGNGKRAYARSLRRIDRNG